MNRVGTGQSSDKSTQVAVEAASAAALRHLGQPSAQIGFLFASPAHNLSIATRLAARLTGASVAGATSCGQFTEQGVTGDPGLTLLLLSTTDLFFTRQASAQQLAEESGHLTQGWAEASREGVRTQRPNSMSVMLVDGLSGIGPGLVQRVREETRPYHQLLGGAAGDNGQFKRTSVALDGMAHSSGVAAVHIFSRSPWSVGTGTGLNQGASRSLVTESDNCTVARIDDIPAFEYYRRHAQAKGIELNRLDSSRYLTEHQLGLFLLDEWQCARAPLEVLENGAIRYAGPVAKGTSVSIMLGEKAGILSAADAAVRTAVAPGDIAGLLVFSCVCRKAILGEDYEREVATVRRIVGPNVPFAGFYTYGEIARPRGKLEGWHNSTLVVAGIPK